MARAAPAPAPAPAAAGGGAEGGGADGGAGVLAGSLLAEGLPRGVSLTGFSAVGDLPRGHYALPPEVREVPAAAALDEARAADRASRLRELEKFPLSSVTRYDADEAARRERGLPDDKRAVAVRRPDGSVAKSRGELTFYGAFTGGFSAGYWNTVGSKEGWAPSTFVSSRSKRAEQPANQVEDLMDEEDLQNLQDHRRVLDRGAEERRSLGEPPEAPGAHASRPRAGREQQQRGADGLSYEGLLAASGGGRGGRRRGRAAPCAAAEEAPAEEEAPRPSGAAGGALDAARDGRRLYMQSKRGRGTARAHAYGDFGTGVFDKEDRDAWEDIYHAGDGRAEYDVALAVADREDDKDLEAEGDRRLEDRRLAGLEDVRASCAAVLKADGVQGLPGLEDPLLPEALREDLVEFKVGSSSRVFVGGLPKGCTDEMLSDYFSAFGIITEAAVKKDMESGKSRGFGFVAFESAGSVDAVMADYEKHRIEDKWVEVKRAISQETLEFKERHGSARLLLQREEDELREREELRARCEPAAAAFPPPPPPGAGGPLQAPAEAAGGSSASTAPGPDAQQQRALVQSAGPLWRAVSEENKKALLKNLGRAFVTGLEQDMDGKTARHEPFKSDPKKQKRYTAFCLALEGKASASEALRDGGGLGEAEREAELADFGRVYRLFRRDNPDADIEAVLQPAAGPSLAPALQRTVQAWAPDKLLCKRWRVPAPEQDGAEGASLQASAKRQKAYSAQVQRGLARAAWDAAPGGAPAAAAAPGPRGAAPGERQAAARARCPQGPPPGSLFSAMFGDEDS